jgi:hypothetical protein
VSARRTIRAGAVLVALITASRSAAGEPLRWSLAVDPETCDLQRLVREVRLACDALGTGCVVTQEGSQRRAVLRCPSNGAWTVDAYDADGRLTWTFALDGEDRMRRAAIWIARATADPMPDARPAPGVAPALGAASPSPDLVPGSGAPSAPTTAPGTGASVERSPPPSAAVPRRPARPAGLLGAARLVLGTGFGPAVGGVVQGGWVVGPPELALEVDVAGERALSSPAGFSEAALRAGAGFSFGAPWGRSPIGVALEAGVLVGEVSPPPAYAPVSLSFARPFARASLAGAWGTTRPLRPYAGLSLLADMNVAHMNAVRVVSDGVDVATLPAFSGSLDVGVAWLPW